MLSSGTLVAFATAPPAVKEATTVAAPGAELFSRGCLSTDTKLVNMQTTRLAIHITTSELVHYVVHRLKKVLRETTRGGCND